MALQYLIESVEIYHAKEKNCVLMQGWAISDDGVVPEITYKENGIAVNANITFSVRNDILKKINKRELLQFGMRFFYYQLDRR